MSKKIRIGGASGFWGDASLASAQLVSKGNVNYLVSDYLAEITMSIMARARAKNEKLGYATDFIQDLIAPNLSEIDRKGIKIISNAGGVNPLACAEIVENLISDAGVNLKVATILGDDLITRIEELSDQNYKEQTSSPYTLIPGLDMPSIPSKQKIYQPNSNGGSFDYSTEKYFLYSLDITIYIDEEISTGSLQQNIKTLVVKNIPEIAECDDCVKFETINFLSSDNSKSSRYDELLEKIELLEQDRRDAEMKLQNWRFEQLEDQLVASEDARSEWEEQARDRDEKRREEDARRLENLQTIEQKYREKQDSLYILTSIKLDEALRGRIESEENTKQELLELIKLQIQGENINDEDFSSNTKVGLYGRKPMSSSNALDSKTRIIILLVVLFTTAILFVVLKNRQPIYLKPKANNNSGNSNKANEEKFTAPSTTEAHNNDDVVRSELKSLRQSAVAMSVSQKDGANQIVQDWLSDGTTDDNNDTEEQDNKE